MNTVLTPEQEQRAQQAFAERSFDPEEYARNLCPELTPEQQVIVAEAELRSADPSVTRVERDAQDAETLAAWKQRTGEMAEEFCFLDPADYADEEARTGRVLTPLEFWHKLKFECGLECWFSLADAAVIAKELNPRDVALAYRKIGSNPENIYNVERWRDAIAEIKQEESLRQPLCNVERFALQVCRKPGIPEYVCWLPGAHLREYALVKFDEHGVPDFHIPGWRDALLSLIRKHLLTEKSAHAVFGEPTGPASRRYKMILAGLRNRPYVDDESESPAAVRVEESNGNGLPSAEDLDRVAEEEEVKQKLARCSECGWAYGEHRPDCSNHSSMNRGED